MVDHRGLPLAITLPPGQASDKAAVTARLAAHPAPGDVVADRRHDTRAILALIEAYGGHGHIPTQRDRPARQASATGQRNPAERVFNKLQHVRKTATRYERSARNDLVAVPIACSRPWVMHYESAS